MPTSSTRFVAVLAVSLMLGSAAQATPFRLHPYLVFGGEDELTASISLGDVDGDGDLDAVVINGRHWTGQDQVFFNNGSGFFTLSRNLGEVQATGYEGALADFDGDGDLDIAIAHDRLPLSVLYNDGHGVFEGRTEFGPMVQSRAITAADLDGDGDVDLALSQRGSANLVYRNDGAGRFDPCWQ